MDYQQINNFELRRKFWKFFGASITINKSDTEQPVGFIKMKAWKLREDIRLFADSTEQQQLLQIHARQIIDFGATYDVSDPVTGKPMWSLRRKGLKSTFVRDHWLLINTNDQQFGFIQETSSGLAVIRRYVGFVPFVGSIAELVFMFFPQTYTVNYGSEQQPDTIATITHRKNPFIVKMNLAISGDPAKVDHRVPLSATAMLMVIDAAKN